MSDPSEVANLNEERERQSYQRGFKEGGEQASRAAGIGVQAMETLHKSTVGEFATSLANLAASSQRQLTMESGKVAKLQEAEKKLAAEVVAAAGRHAKLAERVEAVEVTSKALAAAEEKLNARAEAGADRLAVHALLAALQLGAKYGHRGPSLTEIEAWRVRILGKHVPDAEAPDAENPEEAGPPE